MSEAETKLKRYKSRLTADLADDEALKLLAKLKSVPITLQLAQTTSICAALSAWTAQTSRVSEKTKVKAQKLMDKWKHALRLEKEYQSDSDDSTQSSDSDNNVNPYTGVKQETNTEEGGYSPGGGGDDDDDGYRPSSKAKKYTPGAFFLDNDDDEDDDDEEQDGFIDDDADEDDEDNDNAPQRGRGDPFADDDDDIAAMLAAEEANFKADQERNEIEAEKERRRDEKHKRKELEEKARLKAEKRNMLEEKERRRVEKEKAEKRKIREKRKAEEEAEERKRKKRKLAAEVEERRKMEKRRIKETVVKKERIKHEHIVKTEPIDPFADSDSDHEMAPPQVSVKTEPVADVFGDDDDDSDESEPDQYIKSEPLSPSSAAPSAPPPNQVKKKKKDEIKVVMADKSKKRKKEDKMKTKTNLTVKKEIDTAQFSFAAMMTMNTSKVKKKKKVKVGNLGDEHDESVLEMRSGSSAQSGKKQVIKKKKEETEMTDAEAAKLATQRKKTSQYSMTGAVKKRFVPKVYSLFDLSEKVLKNNAEYLLCRHQFMLSADVIMSAMERLKAEQLHRLEKMQPHLAEDTNMIWRTLCIDTHGKRSAESIEGSGESWKEGFIRLRHESDAKLKLLTQKITKKKAKEDSKSLKSQLAFATGYVKPPKGIRAAQLKNGTFNDIRNKRFDVHVPGVTNTSDRYTESRQAIPGQRRTKAPVANRVNIASGAQNTVHRNQTASASQASTTGKKTGPLMMKALRGLKTFRK